MIQPIDANNTEWRFSQYVSEFSGDDGSYWLFSGLTGALVNVVQSLTNLSTALMQPEAFERDLDLWKGLRRGMFIVPRNLDEIAYLEERYQWLRHRSSMLGVTIVPTYACNLNCSYCFQSNTPTVMSSEIIKRTVDTISRQLETSQFSGLVTTWYGGEPLLSLNVIVEMSEQLIHNSGESDKTYWSYMVTNGTMLNEKRVEQLVKCHVKGVQVTVDGPPEIHNQRRPCKNSQNSSFDACMQGIATALEKLPVSIRVNIDMENESCLDRLLDSFEAAGFFSSDKKAHVYLGKTSNFSGITCRPVCNAWFDNASFSAVDVRLQEKMLSRGFIKKPSYPDPHPLPCTAVDADAFIVDPLGKVYKCWLDVEHPDRAFGEVGEPVNFLSDHYMRWLSYNPYRDNQCKSCPVLPSCGGGCPAEAMLSSDKTKEVCKPWRFKIEEYLKMRIGCEKAEISGIDCSNKSR